MYAEFTNLVATELTPIVLKNSQEFVKEKHGLSGKPVDFVFHGGSGSSRRANPWKSIGYVESDQNELRRRHAVGFLGWCPRVMTKIKKDYLQAQLGNPEEAR